MSTTAATASAHPSGFPLGWNGGASPFGITWQKMMMWFFIVTDALLFGGFLTGYGFNRLAAESWPDRHQVFHFWFITLMTFILISSSATMGTAVEAAARKDFKQAMRFLALTIAGGLCFLGMQAFEWVTVIGEGARLNGNPWGTVGFSSFFFLITGFHGTHVLIGLIVLAVVTLRGRAGRWSAEGVELAGLYWHFVDLVWVFVFGCFYLI